ncbi:unnamed protein product, partial [marine sediment metagenome]
ASFIENRGQVGDEAVKYVLKGGSTAAYLTDEGMTFCMSGKLPSGENATAVFKMAPAGANETQAVASEKLPGIVNYLKSSFKLTNIPTYARVTYRQVYPGIDMIVFGSQNRLKTEFHLAPGADVGSIQVDCMGVEGLSIADNGDLHIQTAVGEVVDGAPFAYQDIDGERVEVPVSYRLIDADTYGFAVQSAYDVSHPLVVDPDLVWSTFLGDDGNECGKGIAVDSSGNVFVCGVTEDPDFPTTDGAYQTTKGTAWDGFVTKVA